MKTLFRILLPFVATVIVLAAVMLIVAAANFMPFWMVIPIGAVDAVIFVHEMS